MIILERKRDESIVIGNDVTITVVDIHGDKVRLGVSAPTEFPVHRKEVYDAIVREREARQRRDEKAIRRGEDIHGQLPTDLG